MTKTTDGSFHGKSKKTEKNAATTLPLKEDDDGSLNDHFGFPERSASIAAGLECDLLQILLRLFHVQIFINFKRLAKQLRH